MNILCIDTCSELGHIVLANGPSILAVSSLHSRDRQGESLMPRIDTLCREHAVKPSDLDMIGVCIGPGGFTSLRVGLSTAKGLAMANDALIVGALSLRVMARSAGVSGIVVPVLNAYRGDVFAAAYNVHDAVLTELCAPSHGPVDVIEGSISESLGDREFTLVGDAVRTHPAVFDSKNSLRHLSDVEQSTAEALHHEVWAEFERRGPDDLLSLQAEYLRPSDAKLPSTPQRPR
ncbi:MAG: tRNA (adenosine(37)-N6)-threonylcarbamoyltransferase complex dimerization subunit type 1 TsaB [Polyangiales bacterium]